MQFVDLPAQQKRIREKIDAGISTVLDHGRYILGPEVGMLEERCAGFSGVRHAMACSSGTDALLLALMAYDVGPGDAVFTTPFTFIATAEVISLLGAVPVFVDIDPRTFNIDPEKLETAVTALADGSKDYPLPDVSGVSSIKPKGIISVDLFGLPADYDRIHAVAEKKGLFVIEDAAQSFGAAYKGKKAGSLAHVGCTSFYPAKPLGCYGDGGMCFTDDDKTFESMQSLKVHGEGTNKYDNVRIGINGRLDTIQAAVLLAKLDIFEEEVTLRQQAAGRYTAGIDSGSGVTPPYTPEGYSSVWAQYSLLAENSKHREELQKRLGDNDIPTVIYYPKPLHMQEAFASLGYGPGDFPATQDASERIFSLPMHPYLTEAEQEKVVSVINSGV